ncbi:hypothetical protein [Pseudomonas gingeri]|uniref:hypothetical protein n=1 Tax=Pseudomonas gingeri TaxID=117681 RepID=UPI0015A0612F|nr:hypothetical protein [Pseudomonas gingeri]NWE28814.1 hypothetical protein [Pseudomonas gingeri]NWE95174.1 hypothetical protein [Pseudomonas gingeri]
MQLHSGEFLGWPAWTLRHGELALQVVPDIGGRLMGIECAGTQLCFIHPQLVGEQASDDPQVWERLCGSWSFPLWGGGKTWVAPETAWPEGNPHRDLDSGRYTVLQTWVDDSSAGIELLSPVCRQSGLRIRRKITLQAQTQSWTVQHTLSNTGDGVVPCGIWDVLMLRRAGQVVVDLGDSRDEPFRAIAGQGSLEDLTRQELIAVDAGNALVRCEHGQQFKVGLGGGTGLARVRLDLPEGRYQYWRFAPVVPGTAAQAYAHGHPTEVFNAPDLPYFEIESHSPKIDLLPGRSISYTLTEGVSRG